MKNILLLLSLVLLFSCSDSTSQNNTTVATEEPAPAAESPQAVDPLGDPCQIPAADVAATFGWPGSNEATPNQINSERIQACDYSATQGSGYFTVSFTRHSERTIERKGLEASFQKDLENTNGSGMTSQPVADGFGDQSIYGHGKRGPNHTYILRWRMGNHTEHALSLRSSKKLDATETLAKLKQLAAKL